MVVTALAFGVSFAAGWIDRHTIERLIHEPGPVAMLTYIALVFCLELLWCPRMWGLLAGGLLFGPWRGAALSLVADMLSAGFCFALARGGGRVWVAAQLNGRPRARALIRSLAHRRGGWTVFLMRVLPVHYTAVSYASGVAGVSWRAFLLGTLLGALPGALLYNAVGDAARQPASPVFVLGVSVLLVLGLVGAALAHRLWRSRHALAPTSRPDGDPVAASGVGAAADEGSERAGVDSDGARQA